MKNNQAVRPVAEFEDAVTQARLRGVEKQVSRFHQLLEGERALMELRNVGDLPSLVAQKNAIIAELVRQEEFMIELFGDHGSESAVRDLKQQLEECRELNRINQSLAAIELNATHKGLELLRSLQLMDDLPLYGSAGKISFIRQKRRLGEA